MARPVSGVVEDPHGGLELHLANAPVPRLPLGLVSAALLAVPALPRVERLGERVVVDGDQVVDAQGHHFQLEEGQNYNYKMNTGCETGQQLYKEIDLQSSLKNVLCHLIELVSILQTQSVDYIHKIILSS